MVYITPQGRKKYVLRLVCSMRNLTAYLSGLYERLLRKSDNVFNCDAIELYCLRIAKGAGFKDPDDLVKKARTKSLVLDVLCVNCSCAVSFA